MTSKSKSTSANIALSHISDAAFFRLMMQHLPVDRALYLDSDMVVTQSHTICSTSICAAIPLQRYKIPFCPYRMESPTGLHTTPYFNSDAVGRLGAMAGTQYRGATAETAACLNEAVPYGDQCFLIPSSETADWIERVLELPNRRSRIFPKRSLGEYSPNPTLFHPLSTTPHAPNRGLCDYSRFLLSKSIGNTIAPTDRTRNFRSGFSFPSIILEQPIIKSKGRLKLFQTAFKP